jgi:hypothetical protein
VGEAGDFKCLWDPPQALSLKKAGFFFWARVGVSAFPQLGSGMCRVPGRRRMGVGFKIGLGGDHTHPPYLSTQPRWFRRTFFCILFLGLGPAIAVGASG